MKIILSVLFLFIGSAYADPRMECAGGGGEGGHWNFVTCLWFAPQECGWSCPEQNGYKIVQDESQCPDEFMSYACYCWKKD